MPTINWLLCDLFKVDDVIYGIVVGENTAVMVDVENPHKTVIWRGEIPKDALPVNGVPYEIQMAFWGALIGSGALPAINIIDGNMQPATDVETINITEYLPYPDEEAFKVTSRLIAPRSLRSALRLLQAHRYRLQYDGAKTQGLEILHANEIVGHVVVWSNENWLEELHGNIKRLKGLHS